jgi:hypothetical protein
VNTVTEAGRHDAEVNMWSRTRGRIGWTIVAAIGLVALVVAIDPSRGGGRASPAGLAGGSRIFGVTKESAGTVTVALTPKEFANERLVIEMAVTTHTIDDLDKHDLKKDVALVTAGKAIAPSSAPSLGGHHSRGELVFPLETSPTSLVVEIRDLGEPGVQVLRWP